MVLNKYITMYNPIKELNIWLNVIIASGMFSAYNIETSELMMYKEYHFKIELSLNRVKLKSPEYFM